MVDSLLSIEGQRVATQVRQSHLKLNNRSDVDTNVVLDKLQDVETFITDRLAARIKEHPAYPWFSRIKGVGRENIGKVVGFIDITKANTVSSLWKFAGFSVENGHAPKRTPGQKLSYNSTLRSMCWRLSGAILKSGIRQYCTKCSEQRPPKAGSEDPVCPSCGGQEYESRPQTKFAEYYLKEKRAYVATFTSRGVKIVPADELPKDEHGKRYEPSGMISELHVHNMAVRKMIKLFLACLWQVWREGEGLPVRPPYPVEHQGHTHVISAWDMVDEPAKTSRKGKSSATSEATAEAA